ncbi:hypothetical protein CHARACLAT_032647 [Characodon lateralis]|uniref:Uncharacterized protein n=1 Tax=Characodon lateralis TaxID=208331 RepID=A0ABU7EG94_9TELE|nr:hypothetical protein [Characodon lateralis]
MTYLILSSSSVCSVSQYLTLIGLFWFFRLSEGLNTFGLLDLMKIHTSIFKEVFSSSERPLKATDLISSPPESNPWQLENRVEGYWRDFLLDVEGDSLFTERSV